jgi:dynein heavy chain 2, cytosolic
LIIPFYQLQFFSILFFRMEADQFNVEIPEETKDLLTGIEQSINVQKEQWNQFANFANDFDNVQSEEWSVYRRRPYLFTDLLTKWETTCRDNASASTARISNRLNKYRSVQPILTILQSDALTEKQWIRIFQLLNIPPKPYYDVLLGDVMQNMTGLIENATEIQTIVKEAASEQIVRQAISELEQWSVTATLKTVQHTDSRGNAVTIIKDFQEVLNKIGDNQSLLQAAKVSVAFEAFSDQADIWETKLNQLDFILTNMNAIQRKWIYLEPIFSAGTLKSEEAAFSRIDKDFRYIMREIFQDPRVMSLIRINNVQNVIDALVNQLSRCQNTLTSYVTNKRNAFARFYFLSDDDLLEILGQVTKEPNIIQKHIKKLFPGVHQLKLVDRGDKKVVTEIMSAEGDSVKLANEITVAPPVEDWLNQLVAVIRKTLQQLTKQCCQTQVITLEHVQAYPMQVFCIANSVLFTRSTEKAISSMALPDYQKNLKTEITKYAKALHQTKNKLLQIKIRALLFDMVYQSNTLQYLIDHNVTNIKDWFWVSQLRFSLNKQEVAIVRMVYAEFEYSYEYLGNFTKLVYTSLTHNCYLTLTQAMHLGMGGNPFGPAGTGKTECVKALGAMLGRLVFVFNCNENVDSDAMTLILSGLARCGAWGCFDEFNRLQDTTLSAISMMIQPLMSALKDKGSDFYIQPGEKIPLNPDCNIFVTLNPASEDYGGRQKLPTNLQALFRPIVMQQPEPEAIAKVILFVEGFERAEEIGKKIVELFRLAEKMLSPQKHYDWGLRELKTVLMACGNSLYDNKDESDHNNELTLAVNVIRTNTMSKLTLADYKRFNILISNVFTGVHTSAVLDSELRNRIQATFTTLGYQANERQTQKCLELYEQLMKRMGVVVIGPPSSGKSTIITILRETLIASAKTIRNYVISPKSMSRTQLLGYLDQDTRQWHDGVMTNTAIAVSSEPMDISSWIVCDGDIDPEWIEALNSVLDDNHLLTLPSGWRIQFQDNVNFIFETHDLTHASPATISRMGIIYVSAEDLDDNLVLDTWADKQTDAAMFHQWTDDYLKSFVAQKSERQKFLADIPTKVMLQNPLSLLEEAKTKDEFCVNMMRGVACLMNSEHRNEFANLFFEFANVYVTDPKRAELAFFNGFRASVELYETEERSSGTLVATASTKFNIDVLKSFLTSKSKLMFLMVGPSGSGKTLVLQHVVTEFPGYQLLTINCSAHLIAQHVIHALKQHCLVVSGIRGKEFKPKFSRLVIYMKNLDLCAIDPYGTCEVVELLLQLYHRNGFYSETLEWISVSGVQICGSVSTLDKHSLSARFLYAAKILTVDYPSSTEMLKIIESFFLTLFASFKTGGDFKVQRLATAVTDFFREVQEAFPQDVSRHYKFTPKHIEQWITGLANYPQEDFQEAMVYECNRIFRDRLMTAKEKGKFDEMLSSSLRGVVNANGICFFIPSTSKSAELVLFPAENWKDMVQRNVSVCNSEYLAINVPIQDEQLNSVAQLCRCLSRPQTNILVVGKSGSGRTEAVAIASAILNVKLVMPTPIESYGINEFYNDLRQAMQAAATEDETVVFMIDHSWIRYSTVFLGPIEAILQGSEIPDLFGDDLEAIASNLKSQAQLEGYQESMVSYFLKSKY